MLINHWIQPLNAPRRMKPNAKIYLRSCPVEGASNLYIDKLLPTLAATSYDTIESLPRIHGHDSPGYPFPFGKAYGLAVSTELTQPKGDSSMKLSILFALLSLGLFSLSALGANALKVECIARYREVLPNGTMHEETKPLVVTHETGPKVIVTTELRGRDYSAHINKDGHSIWLFLVDSKVPENGLLNTGALDKNGRQTLTEVRGGKNHKLVCHRI